MPEFLCRVGTQEGGVIEQRRVALTAEALKRELATEGFHVFDIRTSGGGFGRRRERVKQHEFLIFNSQLKTLLKAGLPLAQSLDLLAKQQTSPQFGSVLRRIHEQVTSGTALSDAFMSMGEMFPRLYSNSLRAGERSGEMEQILERFIQYQRMMHSASKKVTQALTYPLILISLSIGLVTVLLAYVIPRFTDFYSQMDAELPLPTRIVIGLADFVGGNIHWMVLGTIVGFIALRAWYRSPTGRLILDRWTIKIPILGTLAHLFGLSQMTRSLSVLLAGGTPMVPSLETAASSVSNAWLSELFFSCVPKVEEGQALSDTFEKIKVVPPLALAMVRVGESTGELPSMLEDSSDFFDEEIEVSLARIVTLIEPAVLVFMGFVVAGLLLAVYYPLLAAVTTMGG